MGMRSQVAAFKFWVFMTPGRVHIVRGCSPGLFSMSKVDSWAMECLPYKILAPMGARRDEEPNMLGTPLGARTISYGGPPCLVGVEERGVTS